MKNKYLHVEVNEGGVYVYIDDKKREAEEISEEQLAQNCCMLDGKDVAENICVFNKKLNVCLNIDKLK